MDWMGVEEAPFWKSVTEYPALWLAAWEGMIGMQCAVLC